MRRRRTAVPVAVATAFGLGLVGCSSSPPSDAARALDELVRPTTTVAPTEDQGGTTPTTTISPSQQACQDQELATASIDPAGFVAGLGDGLDDLRQRPLLVGVDENTLGFSARDSTTGEIEGFEVELAREIARRLYGSSYRQDLVDLVPLVTDEKTEFVVDGQVDMTISAITMSCSRWEDVAFSTEYYTADQQFLVRADATIETVDDLARKTVCVTEGSSSAVIMRELVPDAELLPVPARTDCLVALQDGDADAYFGHDSFLYGMLPQDPNLRIVPGLLPADRTVSHYGIAISHDRPELVRLVNTVLEELRVDGTWAQLYEDLRLELPDIAAAKPPPARYRDGS